MTELSYLNGTDAAYVARFTATVVALPPGAAVLDRTFFYPTGGGQPSDEGAIRVPDQEPFLVREVAKSGREVLHRVGRSGGSPLTVGGSVVGELDWPRRHRHMRLHTAQHLLSARVFDRTGLRTVRANMSGRSAALDLEGLVSGAQLLQELSDDLNAERTRPHAVRVSHLPRAEFNARPSPRSGLVPLAPQVDPVRLIEIDGLDECPCGGTHLRTTAEIGSATIAAPVPISGGRHRLVLTLGDSEPPTPSG